MIRLELEQPQLHRWALPRPQGQAHLTVSFGSARAALPASLELPITSFDPALDRCKDLVGEIIASYSVHVSLYVGAFRLSAKIDGRRQPFHVFVMDSSGTKVGGISGSARFIWAPPAETIPADAAVQAEDIRVNDESTYPASLLELAASLNTGGAAVAAAPIVTAPPPAPLTNGSSCRSDLGAKRHPCPGDDDDGDGGGDDDRDDGSNDGGDGADPIREGCLPVPGFRFEPRRVAIDWRRVAATGVERLRRQGDPRALEPFLTDLALGELEEGELEIHPVLLKAFHMAQLSIQYLLFCQQTLHGQCEGLKRATHRMELKAIGDRRGAHIAAERVRQLKKESRKQHKIIDSYASLLRQHNPALAARVYVADDGRLDVLRPEEEFVGDDGDSVGGTSGPLLGPFWSVSGAGGIASGCDNDGLALRAERRGMGTAARNSGGGGRPSGGAQRGVPLRILRRQTMTHGVVAAVDVTDGNALLEGARTPSRAADRDAGEAASLTPRDRAVSDAAATIGNLASLPAGASGGTSMQSGRAGKNGSSSGDGSSDGGGGGSDGGGGGSDGGGEHFRRREGSGAKRVIHGPREAADNPRLGDSAPQPELARAVAEAATSRSVPGEASGAVSEQRRESDWKTARLAAS
ncbi:unnamed protein product, partial [Phaeothamnion confervicola]